MRNYSKSVLMFKIKVPFILFLCILFSVNSMAQSDLLFKDKLGENNAIVIKNENAQKAALILKSHLDQSFSNPFLIKVDPTLYKKKKRIEIANKTITLFKKVAIT